MLCEALLNRSFHISPRLLQRNFGVTHFVDTIVCPTRRITHVRVDIFESNGEVDINQVEVLQSPIFEGVFDGWNDVFAMECTPYLCDNKEFFASN
jgi:hypothetical protein